MVTAFIFSSFSPLFSIYRYLFSRFTGIFSLPLAKSFNKWYNEKRLYHWEETNETRILECKRPSRVLAEGFFGKHTIA